MSSKDCILELLEYNKDHFLSGEEMARSLSISRNAVWKAINELRALGYRIDAVRNKGYRLSSDSDIISSQGISAGLTDKASALILVYDSLESTNKTAKEFAINSAKHGTVIVADYQTRGKAHNNESFSSPSGGIYMSLILSPDRLPFEKPSDISKFSAYAVVKALSQLTAAKPVIRNVTDIYDNNKKIAGILNESALDFETGRLQWVIIGVGIPMPVNASRNSVIAAIINNILCPQDSPEDIIKYYNDRHSKP